jgi:transcriptional regulator with XRE-family HTH domain
MNEAIAANIRILRGHRSWTQDHLAEAAGLTPRTIQRAESGQGMTAETLSAIAGAFNVDLDVLRVDLVGTMAAQFGVKREELTPELVEKKLVEQRKELDAKYIMVAVTRVTAPVAFQTLEGLHALCVESLDVSEQAQDVVAELQEHLQDYIDVVGDIGPVNRRAAEKAAFGFVEQLEVLGCAVSVGSGQRTLVTNRNKMRWGIGYVVVTKADAVKPFIAMERNQPIRVTS